jgi:uncharacterized protein (DUF1800 family)
MNDKDLIAHLLRRFALGASESEMDFYGQDGYEGAVGRLFQFDQAPDPSVEIAPETLRRKEDRFVPMPLLQGLWYTRLLATTRPLPHKMAIFWQDHFAVSASKVNQAILIEQYFDLLYRGALGSFKDLLHDVSKSPAMLLWLDARENVKGSPNENFAREVMELYTLGIGHYTEQDIQEAARAFTGWNFRRTRPASQDEMPDAIFYVDRRQHDSDPKTVLGRKGPLTGEDVLDHLCGLPRTAEHIVEKVLAWFVVPDPEKSSISRYAQVFRQSGLDISALLRAIMLGPEFRSQESIRSIVKSPVDFCVSSARALGLGRLAQSLIAQPLGENPGQRVRLGVMASQATKSQGMEIFFPPDVNGWQTGPAWITSATMVERIKWADQLFNPRGRGAVQGPQLSAFAGSTPRQAAERLASIFDVRLSEADLDRVEEAVRLSAAGGLTAGNSAAALNAGARLIFGSPSFQMA